MSTPAAVDVELVERDEQARSWLVREGFLTPEPAGEYAVTDAGRDFMLWALWTATGCPGIPAEAYDGRPPQ